MPSSDRNTDRALELYELEYQRAAERYENIYRSIWTIFSYLTAVAAGLLAFGARTLEPHLLVFLSCTPLLFWFWTTYLPLDRYGNKALHRLKEIEAIFKEDFRAELQHYTMFAHDLSLVKGLWQALFKREGAGIWEQVRRARFAIWIFFILLHILAACELSEAVRGVQSGKPWFIEQHESPDFSSSDPIAHGFAKTSPLTKEA